MSLEEVQREASDALEIPSTVGEPPPPLPPPPSGLLISEFVPPPAGPSASQWPPVSSSPEPPPPPPPPPTLAPATPPPPLPPVEVIPPPPPPSAAEASPVSDSGGIQHTRKRSEYLADLANSSGASMVAAVRCVAGHLNPPYADLCRVCRGPVPQQSIIEVPRPTLGVLRLSTGGEVLLDRGAILGRNPKAVPGAPGVPPHLVQLSDPNRDISSQHLEVRLEDWLVQVRDLGSANGTMVMLPDRPPVNLRANEPMNIVSGTQVVMAGVIEFVFEATA